MAKKLYLRGEEIEAKRYEILEVFNKKYGVYTDLKKFNPGDKLLIIKRVETGLMCIFFSDARLVLPAEGIKDVMSCFNLKEIRLPNSFIEDLKEEPYLYDFATTTLSY